MASGEATGLFPAPCVPYLLTIMRSLQCLVRRSLLFLAGLVLLAGLAGGAALWATLPGRGSPVRLAGLGAPVEIRLDAEGVPHIRAASATDAAEALGWMHARDRLAQMDLMRRAASGTLSEIAGPATLPMDQMMRTIGLRPRAEADLAALDAPTRALLEAYARGVNGWIAARGRFAAPEFLLSGAPAPWSPTDSLLWGRLLGVWLSGNWRAELGRLALAGRMPEASIDALWPTPGAPARPDAALLPGAADAALQLAARLPDFPAPFALPATASDEWALDGRHTRSGAPLLAGDPHLDLGLPGPWYLARIDTPEGPLAGATAPGVPFLVMGHNGRIAWSFTTTGADTQDLFIETPVGADSYLTPDGPRRFVVREERIPVRGRPDEMLRVRETRHGPVISDLLPGGGSVVLALAAANLAPGSAAPGLLALNRAGSVAEAGEAAARILAPVQNLLVADRAGIGLYVTGRVPLRRSGDGRNPAEGADGRMDWTGFAAGAALPHLVAPASGRLVNANEPVAGLDFPVAMGRDNYDDTRARRIRALLDPLADSAPRATAADFAAMQLDTRDQLALDLIPRLSTTPAEGVAARALALLAAWDGSATPDRPEPLIFTAWMQRLRAAMLRTAGVPANAEAAAAPWPMLVPATLAARASPLCPSQPGSSDCTALLARTLQETVDQLSTLYGADPAAWRWGEAHPAPFAHPLARALPRFLRGWLEASIPAPGDENTLLRAGMAADAFRSGRFPALHGAAYRGVYDLANLDRSLFLVAPGQSGNPASALARNFVRRWAEGGMVRLPAVPEGPARTLELLPEGAP